jgi:DNA-directed RNA polymerase specialized sigma24 family protein
MQSDESFADLMTRLNQDDPQAAAELCERYVAQLVRLAAHRLGSAFRRKVDPEDLVQSALGSFFRRNSAGAFQVESWDGLWALLATLTLRKCRFQVRHFLAGKRHLEREVPLGACDPQGLQNELLSSEPTPLEAAALGEMVEKLLDATEGKTRLIAELALQGFSAADVAPKVGLTERSVYRQMRLIRARLRELAGDPEPLLS